MRFHHIDNVSIVFPRAALAAVFEECDRFDHDETGGRIVGTFEESGGKLTLRVKGVIEPGPSAQRTAVFFMQDGAHQENIFRQIEQTHPEIEHLGNWHTHHMNGLSHLSGGDLATYERTVNHKTHNIPFFYALLVVAKQKHTDPLQRYSIKHYFFKRDDPKAYEIPAENMQLVDTSLVWPLLPSSAKPATAGTATLLGAHQGRAHDQAILREIYPGIRSLSSPKFGLYWRGVVRLVDGSQLETIVVEHPASPAPVYSIMVRSTPNVLAEVIERITAAEFTSARVALVTLERQCSKALYENLQSVRHDNGSVN